MDSIQILLGSFLIGFSIFSLFYQNKLISIFWATMVVLSTIGFILSGILGSLDVRGVKKLIPQSIIDFGSEYFLYILISSIFIFFIGQLISHFHDQSIKNSISDSVDKIDLKLSEALTLPSENFLITLHRNVRDGFEQFREFNIRNQNGRASKNTISFFVNSNLQIILGTLKIYKEYIYGSNEKVTYASNIMIFDDRFHQNKRLYNQYKKSILFNEGQDLYSLKGVLKLENKLSASSNHRKKNIDIDIKDLNMCLPVPKKSRKNDKYTVLPGAPLAFLSSDTVMSVNHYANVKELSTWMEEDGDFKSSTSDAMIEYFEKELKGKVQSFLSIPLKIERETIGVLNIHSNQPNLLKEKQQLA